VVEPAPARDRRPPAAASERRPTSTAKIALHPLQQTLGAHHLSLASLAPLIVRAAVEGLLLAELLPLSGGGSQSRRDQRADRKHAEWAGGST
jgi:hypothetical protein